MLEKKIDQENEVVQPEDINNIQADPLITQSGHCPHAYMKCGYVCSRDDEIFVPRPGGGHP